MMHINEIRTKARQGAHGFPTRRNWYSWCQAFVAWVKTIASRGVEPHWYPSARAAWNASPPAVSMDPFAAPPGAVHWFTAGHPDYDSKTSLGKGRIAHAYRDHDFPWPGLINVGEDEWNNAASRAPWMRSTYLGWTNGFGPNGVYKIDVQVDDPIPSGAVRLWNGEGTANARQYPGTNYPIVKESLIAGKDYGDMKAVTFAQEVNGENRWVQGYYSDTWFWLGSFPGADVSKLPVVPDPRPVTEEPAPEPYTFEAFHPVVSDVIPTIVPLKAERGNFPARPTKVVIHDFGELDVHTYRSVINDFTKDNGRDVSSHFVVGWDEDRSRIVQMVSLDDRAYHAGEHGNDFVGIEVDPLVNTDTPEGARLRLDVASLLSALHEHYGYDMIRIKHTDVPEAATLCGDDINLSWWEAVVEPPPIDIKPGNPQKPNGWIAGVIALASVALTAILGWIFGS